MLVCEIILKNWDYMNSNILQQLAKTLVQYSKVHKTVTVQKLHRPPAIRHITRIGESYEEGEGWFGIETQDWASLYKLAPNVYMVTTKSLTYDYSNYFYDDSVEVSTSDDVIFFRVIGDISDDDLTRVVYSKVSLFDAYHCPLYQVIADMLGKANELKVSFSDELVFIEPFDDLCAPYGEPLHLPFLALRLVFWR